MTYSGRRTGKRALGHGLFGISARSRRSRWHGLLRSCWSSAFSKTFSNRARKDDECATHSEGTDGADGGVGMKQGVVVVALRRDLRLTALDPSTNMWNGGFLHSHQERLWRRMTTQIQSSQFVSWCKVAARFQSLYTTWRGWAHVASQQQWWRGVRALAVRIESFKRVRKADVQWAHDLRLLFMCMYGWHGVTMAHRAAHLQEVFPYINVFTHRDPQDSCTLIMHACTLAHTC